MSYSVVFNTETGMIIRAVKNLGYLLRHWKDVQRFEVVAVANKYGRGGQEAILTAYFDNGTAYRTDWASLPMCFEWLDRPVFRGVKCNYHTIGYGMYAMKCGDKLTFGSR